MIYEGTIKRAMPEKPGNEVPGSAVKIAVGTSLAEVLLPPFLPQTKVHMEGNQKGSL